MKKSLLLVALVALLMSCGSSVLDKKVNLDSTKEDLALIKEDLCNEEFELIENAFIYNMIEKERLATMTYQDVLDECIKQEEIRKAEEKKYESMQEK